MSPQADEVLVAFTSALRAAGLAVTPDRTQAFLDACSRTGAGSRSNVYWSGQATLCSGPDDLNTYGRVFAAWFDDVERMRGTPEQQPSVRTVRQAELDSRDRPAEQGADERVKVVASGTEVLRHRDIAELSRAEQRRLTRLFHELDVRPPTRRSPRKRSHHLGEIDARRTLRDQLRRVGEPGPIRHRRHRIRTRRVVLLVDVSGSMEPYADALLRLAHRVVTEMPRQVEVFTVGTRLTRVTRALRIRDGEAALDAAGQTVPDWSGGTRLGETLKAFVDLWGQRGIARGAVVVVASDGWERGDPELLGQQVQRLARLAHAVVWMNPHRGKAGYLPVQGGIAAVLPHLDALVAGHSMQAFEAVLEEIGDA